MKKGTVSRAALRRPFLAWAGRRPVGAVLLALGGLGAAAAEPGVPGVTKPYKEATLSSSVGGLVAKVNFREGAQVKAGQALVELDRKQEELEVSRRKLLRESHAELDAAAAKMATAKADLESTRRVYEGTKSVSKDELDKKELDYKLAVAELQGLQTAKEREGIEFEMAQEQLRRRQVTAPMDGTVTRVAIEVGEICEPRQPLIHLVDTDKAYFTANAEARVAQRFHLTDAVEIEVTDGGNAVVCRGAVSFVSPVVAAASGLREIKALFDNPEGRIQPGVAGTMRLPEAKHE